ncbi:caspase family protein [Streptomyces sp. NPDC004667]|uniref:caspase family protein n=1 Tax=Streptomyces sp. NPDC004667 TaxID=3154285 RepID=UPI0033B40B68
MRSIDGGESNTSEKDVTPGEMWTKKEPFTARLIKTAIQLLELEADSVRPQRNEIPPRVSLIKQPLHLPAWKNGAAVLVGAYRYEHLEPVPSIKNNLTALTSLLHTGFGIPRANIYRVPNPTSRADIQGVIDEARQAVDPTSGALLVYYAGHGWTDGLGRLQLGLVGSKQKESWTAFPFAGIREQLADSQIPTRVVILDACFSGAALDLLSGGTPTSLAIEGSYVMTSSDDSNTSLAPKADRYTTFTGEIIKALNRGIPNAGDIIGIDALFHHVRGIFEQREWPIPDRQTRTDGDKIQLMRNRWRNT